MRTRFVERLTPVERHAAGVVAGAWALGVLAGALGWDRALLADAEARLHPPPPTVAQLAARLGPRDLRVDLYAAGLALAAERRQASAGPAPLDPNRAGRAEWDRLPGVGPRTALAILAHRDAHGPFRGPEDLLAVRGIGPRTLERLSPWLTWSAPLPRGAGAADAARADLNTADARLLASVPGIGTKLAERVIEERRRRGGFRSWDDVLDIRGIGPSKVRALQNATRLNGTSDRIQ